MSDESPPSEHATDAEGARLAALAEEVLEGGGRVTVADLLREAGEWPAARRVLSQLTAIHHRDELPYTLKWGDGLEIDPESATTWATGGWFERKR